MKKLTLLSVAIFSTLSFSSFAKDCDSSLLPSWKDSLSKSAIVKFVEQTNDKQADTYVAVEDRIAVFDNDGT